MKSKICRQVCVEIEEAGLDQSLSESARAHLEACPRCAAFLQERSSLRNLIGSLESVNAPANFEFRLRARLAAAESSQRRERHGRERAPGTTAIALAACFALLVTAAVIFKQIQSAPASDGPRQAVAARVAPLDQNHTQGVASKLDGDEQAAGEDVESRINRLSVRYSPSNPSRERSGRQMRLENARPAAALNSVAVINGPSSIDFSASRASATTLMVLQGPAMSAPLRVSLEDGNGATRTVSVQPVTFGSHDLVETGNSSSRLPVADAKGIW